MDVTGGGLSGAQVQSLAVTVLVLVLMFGIGLRSEPQDFRRVSSEPTWFGAQVALNFLAVPLVALAALALVKVPAEVRTGIILCAAAPGGAVGPLFASNARSDLPVAVADMVLLSLVAAFLTPWIIALLLAAGEGHGPLSLVVPMMTTLFGVQLLPLSLGMVMRRRSPDVAASWERPIHRLSNGLLLAVVGGLLVTKWRVLGGVGVAGWLLCLGLALAFLAIGGAVGPSTAWRRSFGLVCVVRNVAVALLLAAMWFPAALTDATVLVFGLCTLGVPLGATAWWRRRAGGTP